MNKALLLFFCFVTIFIYSSCELDSFLFAPKALDTYALPDSIPYARMEEVTFKSDGNTLYGYFVYSDGRRPGITILYCHGNKHNIDEYFDRVRLIYETGINLLIFDYRGFGKSEGESSEKGLYADALAALDYLKTRKEYKQDSLCLYGYSLGNVASIYLASEVIKPLCLFSESPFASANSLTQGSLALDIPPLWVTGAEFNNIDKIKKIHTPLLLFHGEADDFVRFRDNGKVVYDNAPEPKELVLIEKASHTDVPYIMGTENYKNKLIGWIDHSIRGLSQR